MESIKWLIKLLYGKKIILSENIKLLDCYKEHETSKLSFCLRDSDTIDFIFFDNSFNKEGKLYFSFCPDFYNFSGNLHRAHADIIIKKINKFISFFTGKKYKIKILHSSYYLEGIDYL